MVVNFRARGISRGTRKLADTQIKQKNKKKKDDSYVFVHCNNVEKS